MLVLVHPGYFISPVPTISGEPSLISHLGRRSMGDQQLHTRSHIIIPEFSRKDVLVEVNVSVTQRKDSTDLNIKAQYMAL